MYKKFLLIVFAAFFLAGCQIQKTLDNNVSETKNIDQTKKKGDTTLTGMVLKVGEKYSVVGVDGKQTEIDSYSIDLNEYVNKQVVLTGQYSGDTLFVGAVGK